MAIGVLLILPLDLYDRIDRILWFKGRFSWCNKAQDILYCITLPIFLSLSLIIIVWGIMGDIIGLTNNGKQ